MDPIESLIKEHKLIQRMLALFDKEIARLKKGQSDSYFIHNAN